MSKAIRVGQGGAQVSDEITVATWRVPPVFNDTIPPPPRQDKKSVKSRQVGGDLMPGASGVLRKAATLIEQRGVERDKPQGERSMASAVAAFWVLHGESILRTGTMTETQGWEFMELLKMARSAGGCYKADDYEDKVAYAALAAEAAAKGAACST